MTWQEELRKLDESLATGNLSADEYRTRRDQILSSAVNSSDPEPEPEAPGNASTQVVAPLSGQQPAPQQPPQVQPQQGQPPQGQPPYGQFPQDQPPQGQPPQAQPPQGQPPQQPPQQAPQQQPPQAQPESTQVVSPADPGAERTQAVQPWQAQQGSPPQGFAQPQQNYPASPPAGFGAPAQGQPWNAPENPAPPWGGGDFPPLSPQAGSEWGVSQGPESFDEPSSNGKGRKIAFSALALVVLAGIGVAVYFLFIAGGDSQNQAQNPGQDSTSAQSGPNTPTSTPLPTPPAAKQTPTDNESALIDPPGKERGGAGEFDKQTMADKKILPDKVVQALQDSEMGKGLLKTTKQDGTTVGLYAIEVGDEGEATAVADEYAVSQQDGNIPPARDLSMQGVPVFGAGNSDGSGVYRTVYVLYDRVVILEVFGPDQEKAKNLFVELLEKQINHAPPSYRG